MVLKQPLDHLIQNDSLENCSPRIIYLYTKSIFPKACTIYGSFLQFNNICCGLAAKTLMRLSFPIYLYI